MKLSRMIAVASIAIVAQFGTAASLAQSQVMKFEGWASTPDAEGNSLTSVKLYLFENGEMPSSALIDLRSGLRSRSCCR